MSITLLHRQRFLGHSRLPGNRDLTRVTRGWFLRGFSVPLFCCSRKRSKLSEREVINMHLMQAKQKLLKIDVDRGVSSGWTGWTMSRAPPPPPNQNDTIGLGAFRRSLSMGPRVVTARGFLSHCLSGPLSFNRK